MGKRRGRRSRTHRLTAQFLMTMKIISKFEDSIKRLSFSILY